MQVDPSDTITPSRGARISHKGTSALIVTITSESGAHVEIEVPPGEAVIWYPPAGWLIATFSATGHSDEVREIGEEAAAG